MGLFGVSVLLVLAIITSISYYFAIVVDGADSKKVHISQVWFFGWLTAISTGLGAVPFYFIKNPSKYYMGISNAIAGGMMIAASYSLVQEGATFTEAEDLLGLPKFYDLSLGGISVGFTIGILFILITKRIMHFFGDPDIDDIDINSANKIFLIIFVMTLHSLSEGIGIGVSFGGTHGQKLGQFISFSLAVHNVPEGLAVALVLTSRKITTLRAAIWSIFTSLPQPFMAIPAFIFVERFVPLLPAGLGFAAGAMFYVAIFELLVEAVEDTSVLETGIVGFISCCVMTCFQVALKDTV
eukprot:gene3567-7094_t